MTNTKIKPTTFRKKTRELLMRLIFQMTSNNDYSDKARDAFIEDESLYIGNTNDDDPTGCLFDKESQEKPDLPYFRWALELVTDNLESIDEAIDNASDKWSITRMSKVDLSILRLSVAEICYMDDINDSVSVNEAVLMAKKYGTEKSPSFINGILGHIVRSKDYDEQKTD